MPTPSYTLKTETAACSKSRYIFNYYSARCSKTDYNNPVSYLKCSLFFTALRISAVQGAAKLRHQPQEKGFCEVC